MVDNPVTALPDVHSDLEFSLITESVQKPASVYFVGASTTLAEASIGAHPLLLASKQALDWIDVPLEVPLVEPPLLPELLEPPEFLASQVDFGILLSFKAQFEGSVCPA